jgi:hypothetical protein
MESKEFLIDKNRILKGEYNKQQVNPAKTLLYTRNSNGTLYVDSNSSDINRQRLVINLVGTKYNLNSYENVLKTEFEEFVETIPDITADETVIQDMSGQLNDYQNQITTRDQKIDNLNATIEELNNKLNSVNAQAVGQSVDVAGTIQAALDAATNSNNKKPRIFSDGTLLRDRNNTAFYYVIEDGKKRWFQFNEELLNIVAKASGKVTATGGPALIDVSQDVLDDIPSGAPFTNFDLVKNIQTPAPPPLDLGGNRLTAKWINIPNPLIITTTNATPTDAELTIPVQLQVASAEGIVNRIEVWEEGAWYQNKPQLPIMDPYGGNANIWQRSKETGFQQGVDSFKVMLRKTNDPVTDGFTTGEFGFSALPLLNAYTKIKLSLDNPEYTIKLAAKILNDVNDEYYQVPEDQLTVIIRYVSKMPNVTNLTVPDARAAITATGVLNNNINVSNLILTNDASLYNKVQSTNPIVGANINKNSIINLISYQTGTLTVPQNISFYSKFNDVVRVLKRTGFNNISVSQIYRTGYTTEDLSIARILKSGNVTLTASSTYKFDDPIYLKVNIWNNGQLIGFMNNSTRTDSILISYLNNLITTIV